MSLDPKTLQQLSAYLDDALTLREKSDVDVLLHRNPEARRALAALKVLRDGVKALPPMAPPEAFYARVWRNIEAAPAPKTRAAWSVRPMKLAGALAAVALVVVATHDFWRSPAVKQRDFSKMAEEAPSPLQMLQTPLEAEQAPAAVGLEEKQGMDALSSAAPAAAKNEFAAAPTAPAPLPPALGAKTAPAMEPPLLQREEASPLRAKTLADESQSTLLSKDAGAAGGARRLDQPMAAAPMAAAGIAGGTLDAKKPEAAKEKAGDTRARSEVDKTAAVPLLREWRGTSSGINSFEALTIRTPAEWAALWARHAPGAAVPSVDFSRLMVVAVFAGDKPTTGHAVNILRIAAQENQWIVSYHLTAPARDAVTGQVVTAPFHMAGVQRSDLPVRFDPQ